MHQHKARIRMPAELLDRTQTLARVQHIRHDRMPEIVQTHSLYVLHNGYSFDFMKYLPFSH